MNPDPEHQRRLKKAAEMLVEKQVNMIKQIMIKSAMGVIEGGMEAVQEAKKREWVGLTDEDIMSVEVLRYHFAMNGGNGPVSKKGRTIIEAVEAKLKEKNA